MRTRPSSRPLLGRLAAAGLAGASLALGACVPTLPPPPQPIADMRVPIPPGSRPPAAASAGAAMPGQVPSDQVAADWWRLFGDAELDRLVDGAVADNPGLAEARARVRAAEAQVDRADAALLPHAESDARFTRLHNSRDGDRAIYNGRTYTLGGLDALALNYHLDLWGQDREGVAAAGADAEVTRARSEQSRLLLTAAVIKTYFAWRTAGWLADRQRVLVDLAEQADRIQAAAVAAGVSPAAAQVTEAAGREQAQALRAQLDQKAAALGYALRALLGRGPDTPLPAPVPGAAAQSSYPLPPYPLPTVITLETLSVRPDIRMALWGVRAAGHRQALARTAYYPNINLHAVTGLSSIGMDDLLRAGSMGYAFGPTLSLPLFEGGALDANLRASAAVQAAAVHTYDKTVLDAAAQVATDLASLDNSRQAFEREDGARQQADRLTAIADAGYRSGVGDRLAPVRSRIRLTGAEMACLAGRLAWLDAVTDTATDLGGGSRPE